MKQFVVLVLTLGLLFSNAGPAEAELLLGAGAATGEYDFSADYDSGADYSDSANQVSFNGELNLIATRLYLEYAQTDLENASFSSYGLQTGWELGPGILRARLLGGLQGYRFEDDRRPDLGRTAVTGLVGGAGVESKLGKVTVYGSALIPLLVRATNDRDTDNGAKITNLNLGVSYHPLPLLDVFVDYRNLRVETDFVTLKSHGYSLGAKLSF
jgi:hypothetical protein